MRSTFYGLEIARRGLFVSQKALDVTGHNVANANTPGYTRQRLITSSIEAPYGSGMFRTGTKGQVGGGVEVQELTQIRDNFLDLQYRKENKLYGEWTSKSKALQYVEDIFSEPSDSGLNTMLGDLFNSMHEMADYPESKEIRTLVSQSAIKFTETLHHYYNQLTQLQKEQDTAIGITVNEINDYCAQVRSLNEQIYKYEIGGETANDLRDKRNLLLDKLSELAGIQVYETAEPGERASRLRIDMNGVPLVDHIRQNELETRPTKANPTGEANLLEIYWKGSSIKVPVNAGRLKGYMDARDGRGPATGETMGVPYFIDKINLFAKTVVSYFNQVQMNGHPIPNGSSDYTNYAVDPTDPALRIPLFVPVDAANQVTAKNIALFQAILDDVYNIACSSESLPASDPSKWGNNNNALDMVALRNRKDLSITIGADTYQIGNLEDYIKTIISDLAVESSHATQTADNQKVLTDHLDNQRQSLSAVSIDEEMTNMLQFQQTYAAAARAITAMDEALDILINRMGLVGR